MISNGLYPQARRKAARNIASLAAYARRGYRIVTTSTSCGYTLKAEYHEMLDLDDDDARAVAEATWDICELLVDLHDAGRLDTRLAPMARDLPYHPPCQLKAHGIGTPALDLFALIPGLRAVESNHDCCGAAGTYGLKKEKLADRPGRRQRRCSRRWWRRRRRAAACDSETCRWQISRRRASTRSPGRDPGRVIPPRRRARRSALATHRLGGGYRRRAGRRAVSILRDSVRHAAAALATAGPTRGASTPLLDELALHLGHRDPHRQREEDDQVAEVPAAAPSPTAPSVSPRMRLIAWKRGVTCMSGLDRAPGRRSIGKNVPLNRNIGMTMRPMGMSKSWTVRRNEVPASPAAGERGGDEQCRREGEQRPRRRISPRTSMMMSIAAA